MERMKAFGFTESPFLLLFCSFLRFMQSSRMVSVACDEGGLLIDCFCSGQSDFLLRVSIVCERIGGVCWNCERR
jgi:hypothetical protein